MCSSDLEWFAAPTPGLQVLANRGANGIDGVMSTAVGVALARRSPGQTRRPTALLIGDVAFLHDTNGLLGAARRGIDLTIVLVDNDGGGIFSFLPQADLPEHFETLFGTPHGIDLAALARVHGIPVTELSRASEIAPAVSESIAAGGVEIVLVRTDRATNVTRHRQVWAAVAGAVPPR